MVNIDALDDGALLSIEETKAAARTGHTKTYELLNSGEFEAVKLGRRTFVKAGSLKRYLAKLPAYQPAFGRPKAA